MLRYGLASLAGVGALIACTTEVHYVDRPVYVDGDGGSVDETETIASNEPPPEETLVGPRCQAYLDCLTETQPEAAPHLAETYGSTSPCWKGSAKERLACENACEIASRSCRAIACKSETGKACVSCCETANPVAAMAYESTFVEPLERVACEQCDEACCDESSLDCRLCASDFSDSVERKCRADKDCFAMYACLTSCKADPFAYGLEK